MPDRRQDSDTSVAARCGEGPPVQGRLSSAGLQPPRRPVLRPRLRPGRGRPPRDSADRGPASGGVPSTERRSRRRRAMVAVPPCPRLAKPPRRRLRQVWLAPRRICCGERLLVRALSGRPAAGSVAERVVRHRPRRRAGNGPTRLPGDNADWCAGAPCSCSARLPRGAQHRPIPDRCTRSMRLMATVRWRGRVRRRLLRAVDGADHRPAPRRGCCPTGPREGGFGTAGRRRS